MVSQLPIWSSSTFSGKEGLWGLVERFFYGPYVLPVTQPPVSTLWRGNKTAVACPHPFFIQHGNPDERGFASLYQRQYCSF